MTITKKEATAELLAIVAQLDDPETNGYPPGATGRNRFGKLEVSGAMQDRLTRLFRGVGGRSGGTDFCDQLAHAAQHIREMPDE